MSQDPALDGVGPVPACRADVWLWRARLFKTRSAAAELISAGRVRRLRAATEVRLDKPSRGIRPGDGLVFASQGRIVSIRVLALGMRRGPPAEARGLYLDLAAADDAAAAP